MAAEARRILRTAGFTFGELAVGPHNAITDVEGVQVGHITLAEGDLCTGVTAVLPCADICTVKRVSGAAHTIHGNGQLTGGDWLNTCGFLETPIMLTNTLSVGEVYSGVVRYLLKGCPQACAVLPVVGECFDGYLNDIKALAITPDHAQQAIRTAQGGQVAEGAVGAGTGMCGYDFKGGIGTASRLLPELNYRVGVLVNSNGGRRDELLLQGRKVAPLVTIPVPPRAQVRDGSFVFVVATDAPLPHLQLSLLAKRVTHGLARTGTCSMSGSGEFVIAFSTTAYLQQDTDTSRTLPPPQLDQLFRAVVDASEEAVWNSLTTADTMHGYRKRVLHNLPPTALL